MPLKVPLSMASAAPTFHSTKETSTKETTNYARLCRLLVDSGSYVLKETFDRLRPPGSLYAVLSSPPVHSVLQSLKRKKVLNPLQWDKLYPAIKSSVSSNNFDITLLMVLLRNICGLVPPATGWNNLPSVADTTLEADIVRIKYYRNTVFGHALEASVDDATFSQYWQDIQDALVRLGGPSYQGAIDDLRNECMDPEFEEHYQELLKQWVKDEVSIKERFYEVEEKLDDLKEFIVNLEKKVGVAEEASSTITSKRDLSFSQFQDAKRRTLVTSDVAGGVMTPQEILARGPLAVQIYNKALKEGKTNVRRLPIMLIGQARMGKTSLKKSLKGDLFDADEKSTELVDLDPSYFEMTTEIWRPGKLDETTYSDSSISFEHQAARLIKSEGLKDIEETFQATSKEPTQTTDTSQQHHEPSTSRDSHVTTREVTNTKQEQPLIELDMANEEQEQPLIEHDMPDYVANLILTKSTFEDIKIDEVEQIYSIVWDFGGQSVYYVTHPLFLTTRAIYMLVYDLSRCPNDPAIPVRKQGLYGTLEDSYSVKTNLDYLDSWMSSVASLVSDDDGDDDEVPASHQTEKLPSKLPPVFLVCTHADKPYCGRDSATLAAEIFNSLQRKPYSSHLIDGVFAVDNSKSGSEPKCPGVVHLRNEIRTVAEELPFMKEEIPLKWLKFEKELQVKIKEGYKWISLENAKQVAFEMCHISEEEEFTTLMTFLHDQRIVIHFDETPILNKMVVLDIQWLINVFKKVIAIEPYGGGGKQYKDQWRKLEKTGILEEKLLEHVWGSLYEDKETFESLIEIMEKFSLLCIWPSSDESKQYLVPSMLRSHPPEDIIQLVESSQIPSLCLTFNSSQVPIGLFPRLVLQFYQWCSKEWPSPCKPQLYHNFAKFFVCPDGGCSVVLLCHSSFIEIVSVHRANEVCDISPDARAVRRQVGLMLECMRKEFVWLKNMKCEMKVLCSVCCLGGSVHYCDDHDTKGCKREECLHFWSETVLQSGQPLICDRPPAVAGDPRLNIKQLASWFAFLDEQNQAIDECAARGLPSIAEEETKTLVLSNGVLESLQSTCDASNVVARLQDKLQLNQAALADPGPETTRMIRCIATIAKNENRPDVVQHLRQITPAGTTGPLLPGRLDVREIRQSQIRDLTISLCGGEDWKLVAEKLGLRPNEISFLDKRTKNPCMETLVHSRNQRFINVDTLYNVLVECGLPRLADLL